MKPEAIRAWAKARAEAARREREEALAPDPDVAVRAALDLLDLVAELHGWPPAPSEDEAREDMRAWQAWARLRDRHRSA